MKNSSKRILTQFDRIRSNHINEIAGQAILNLLCNNSKNFPLEYDSFL